MNDVSMSCKKSLRNRNENKQTGIFKDIQQNSLKKLTLKAFKSCYKNLGKDYTRSLDKILLIRLK